MTDLPSDRKVPDRNEARTGPAGSAAGSLDRIWQRIRRPVDVPAAVEALIGIPGRTARQLVSATVAGSEQASTLLAAMPELIRGLSISTTSVPERSFGEVRGPVLWSETLAARSASAGDPNVFVCATLARAYDTPENRILVGALALIARGGKDVDRLRRRGRDEPALFATARHNGDLAVRFLDHRALLSVRSDKIDRRALARLTHDSRRRAYRPVIDMLRIAAEPLDVPTLRVFCDDETTAEHDLLVAATDHLERRGVKLPPFLVVGHAIVAGPIRFCRAGHPASQTLPGLTIGGTRLLPASSGDSGDSGEGRVISGRADLVSAVDDIIVDQHL